MAEVCLKINRNSLLAETFLARSLLSHLSRKFVKQNRNGQRFFKDHSLLGRIFNMAHDKVLQHFLHVPTKAQRFS